MTVLEKFKTDDRPYRGPGAAPLAVEPYVSQEFYNNYIKGVFRRTWINIARVEEIPNNGDFLVKRIPSVKSGILLIRSRDGVIRAMHNVARYLHSDLVPSAEDSKLVDYALMDPHRRGSFSDPINSDTAPKPKELSIAGAVFGFASLQAPDTPQETPGFNRKNIPGVRFDANVIFPNFGVHARRNSYLSFRYWPDGRNEMTYEINHHAMAPTNYAEAVTIAYHRMLVNAILAEDLSTLERTQVALESRAINELKVGDEEILVRHNHRMVTEAVAKSR